MATPLPVVHVSYTLADLALATGGTVVGDPRTVFEGLGTDTRALAAGGLFVALAGEHFDGHNHLGEAFARGARAVLVRHGTSLPVGASAVTVDDTLRALGDLARAHVRRLRKDLPVVAIGGAVGKTTTKELTAAALRAALGETLSTPGNLNNLVGAPITLLTLTDRHRAAVIECGSNAQGEIARLGAIIEPDVALVTNADAAHTEGLGSIEGVAREEGSLFGFASRAVVGNADEPLSAGEMSRAGTAVARWRFGLAESADARVVARSRLPDGRARVSVAIASALCQGAGTLAVETSLVGPAAASNIAAALAVTAAVGVDATGLARAARALQEVQGVPGRLERTVVSWGGGSVLLLDDTYNSSPRAVRAALVAARELADHARGRLVVAIGDMLELGAIAEDEHVRVGVAVVASVAGVFIAVGPAMAGAADAAEGRVETIARCTDSGHAAGVLSRLLQPGDIVLVKGSRGTRMERCVAALRGNPT